MKTLFLTLFVAFFLVACSTETDMSLAINDPVGQPMLDSKGQKHTFSEYKGKWVIVNYWASWCKPCRKEIPELNKFSQKHRGKAVVIGVDVDKLNSHTELEALARRMDIHYTVTLTDPAPQLGVGKIDVLPTTLVIDPSGRVVKKLIGEQTQRNLERVTGLE